MPLAKHAPAARYSTIAGGAALGLAGLGALVSFMLDPASAVLLLRYTVWVVGALAVLGVVLGLAAGMTGPGRTGTVLSTVTLVFLGIFLTYSAPMVPSGAPSGPAPSAAGG